MRFDSCGWRKLGLQPGNHGIHALQRQHHVAVPIEKEIHVRRTAARGGYHPPQPRHHIYCFFDRARDGHEHLIDRGNAVVYSDDDARKIRLRKDGDWDSECEIRSHQRQAHDQKQDWTRQPLKPWRRRRIRAFGRTVARNRSLHPGYSFSAAGWAGFVGAIFTVVPSGKPYPPEVITASPSFTPETICTASGVRIPTSMFRACATPSAPATRTYGTSSAFFCKAAAGTTIASLTVRAVIETLTVMPGLRLEFGVEASTHTSIVVLPGSSAGLTSVMRPATSRPL